MTLSDCEIFNDTKRRAVSVTAELLVVIIIIINEKINVAFSRRTARTRNSHKKHKPRKRRV